MDSSDDRRLQHVNSLDFLRGLMIFFVLAHHTDLFKSNYAVFNFISLYDLIRYSILFLGVPSFFLISIYLFVKKMNNSDYRYFFKRIETLFYSYVFWVTLWILVIYKKGFAFFVLIQNSRFHEICYFFGGAGIGIFYFHFSLIILTCITYFALKLNKYALWFFTIASLLFIIIMPFTKYASHVLILSYWSPLNFIPYSFIGILLSKKNMLKLGTIKLLAPLFIVSLLIAIGEHYCQLKGFYSLRLPAYMRISNVLSTIFVRIS